MLAPLPPEDTVPFRTENSGYYHFWKCTVLLTNDTAYAPDFFTCSEVERFDRTAKRVVREIRDEYKMTWKFTTPGSFHLGYSSYGFCVEVSNGLLI